MILRKLEVQNFRQLHGESRIEFSPPGPKNVTVFLGENGAGKSTLLSAMRWCLHGEPGLDGEVANPLDLLSHRALEATADGGYANVVVELEFSHEGIVYRVNRRHVYRKVVKGQEPELHNNALKVTHSRRPGDPSSWGEVEAPKDLIGGILPKALLPYFFFAGESAGAWVDPRRAGDLRAAVKNILDFAVLENTSNHATVVANEMDKELGAIATGDGRQLELEIEGLSGQVAAKEEEISRGQGELGAVLNEIRDVDGALAEYEETRPFIERKRELVATEVALSAQLASSREHLAFTIRESAHLALLAPAMGTLAEMLEEAYRKDDLPARIKPGFVDELLRIERCICGTSLAAGSAARESIVAFRQSGGLDTVASELQKLDGRLRAESPNVGRFLERFRIQEQEYHALSRRINSTSAELIEIEHQLEGKRSEEHHLQELLRKRKALSSAIADIERRLRDAHAALGGDQDPAEVTHTLRARLRLKLEERSKHHRGQLEARLLTRRVAVLRSVQAAARRLSEGWLGIVQKHLDAEVQSVYNEVAVLDRRVRFDETCRLSMQELADGRWIESAASSANQAVLALCFVASIIQLADNVSRNATPESDGEAIGGGEFPMVMDAPFAKMGEHFSLKVPSFLARTVPQLIIITSEKQWYGPVQDCLSARVGRAYLLHLHTSFGDTRTVSFREARVAYVTKDPLAKPDYSLIEELET